MRRCACIALRVGCYEGILIMYAHDIQLLIVILILQCCCRDITTCVLHVLHSAWVMRGAAWCCVGAAWLLRG